MGQWRVLETAACAFAQLMVEAATLDGRVERRVILTASRLDMLEQVTNVTCLPGIVRAALCMSDGHGGYGFPIGGSPPFARTPASSLREESDSTSTAGCSRPHRPHRGGGAPSPDGGDRSAPCSRSHRSRWTGIRASRQQRVPGRHGAGRPLVHRPRIRLAGGPRRDRRRRLSPRCRPRASQRAGHLARPPAARHAEIRESLPRDPGGAAGRSAPRGARSRSPRRPAGPSACDAPW